MTTLVLGVGGLLTAGKDVFADRLVSEHGFVKLGMSDILRDATERLTSIYVEDPVDEDWNFISVPALLARDGYVGAKQNLGYRTLLQELGTEVGRKLLGENIWVDAAKRRILEHAHAGRDVVITGIRFENELKMIQEIGWANTFVHPDVAGTTVWVRRAGLVAGAHASEATLSAEDFEYVLENDSTLEALETASSALLETILSDYALRNEDLRQNMLEINI